MDGPGSKVGALRIAVALTSSVAHTYLARQLASIAMQTLPPTVLVIGDDASGPGTRQVIQEFSASAPFPVHVVEHEHHVGFHQNAADALARARDLAEIVLPADHDDLWDPSKIERAAAVFAADERAVLWSSDAILIGPDDRPLGRRLWDIGHLGPEIRTRLAEGGGLEQLLRGATFTAATTTVRATVIDAALPLPTDRDDRDVLFYPDAWLAVMARLLGDIVFDPEPLLWYRRHPEQMSVAAEQRALMPSSASPLVRRRLALHRHAQRVRLVADRVRQRTDVRWDTVNKDNLLSFDSFLTVRTLPRGTPRRLRRVLQQLRSGTYSRFASGARTAAFDVIRPFRTPPGLPALRNNTDEGPEPIRR